MCVHIYQNSLNFTLKMSVGRRGILEIEEERRKCEIVVSVLESEFTREIRIRLASSPEGLLEIGGDKFKLSPQQRLYNFLQ